MSERMTEEEGCGRADPDDGCAKAPSRPCECYAPKADPLLEEVLAMSDEEVDATLREAGIDPGKAALRGMTGAAIRLGEKVQALTAQLRARDEALRVARARMLEVVGSMSDVVSLGRFSRAVDPVRWVEQVKASADAALAAIEEATRAP